MARVKYGGIVTGIAGSVGGSTFQNGQFGAVCRNKPIPRKTGSPNQIDRRVLMMTVHQGWRNLDDSQRNSWNQFVSFSQQKITRDRSVLITGHALFIQINYLRLLTGLSLLEDPVYTPIAPWPVIDKIYATSPVAGLVMDFITNPPGVNTWYVLKMTTPRPPQIKFSKRGLQWLYVVFNSDYQQDIGPSYLDSFGFYPSNGDTIHYEIRHFSLTSPTLSPVIAGTWVLTAP
jgi:hypothetical protein